MTSQDLPSPLKLVTKHICIPPWQPQKCLLMTLTAVKKDAILPAEVHCEFNTLKSQYVGYKFLYTDGAKNDNGVGCVLVHGNRCLQFTLPELCSVFTAEVVAIFEALKYVESENVRKCVICTDSLSVVPP